ncbi:malonate decarboxylase acyl carrier protein [Zoogloea sp.]|uniref:malonate decarboxylase acyl carrier protein n=1 Tax=Zoogloea sp. TaxID=49181 RepID=UPI0035B249A3
MEKLEFRFPAQPATPAAGAALCGVVGSGNLEILIRSGDEADTCVVSVKTSARGFGRIWEAVIAEFAARHAAGGTRIAINDMGATPAVVSLRLGQALGEYTGGVQ